MPGPSLFYIHRQKPHGVDTCVMRGRTVTLPPDNGMITTYVEVADMAYIQIDRLLPIYPKSGPEREIDLGEYTALRTRYLEEEKHTDLWFTQQTDLSVLKAYAAGYEARTRLHKGGNIEFNPYQDEESYANGVFYAWQRGWERHVYNEGLIRVRNEWKDDVNESWK
jgi:hypothetical protein